MYLQPVVVRVAVAVFAVAALVLTQSSHAKSDPDRVAALAGGPAPLTSWPKWQGDLGNTGWNSHETVLTPRTVKATTFGKLGSFPVDGAVYAQPLYAAGVSIPGFGTRNLVLVATEHNSVYAFDADTATFTAPLWQTNLGAPVPSEITGCGLVGPEIGITSTPVIDLPNNVVYVVNKALENNQQVNRLHALDLRTGAELPGWGMLITATYPGADGGAITFDQRLQFNRCGLTLANRRVYVAFASHCDIGLNNYHGWVFGYNADAPADPPQVWNAAPRSSGTKESAAGIWMSGASPAADDAGNLYLITGNGPFDIDQGGQNAGDSFIKLSTSGGAGLVLNAQSTDYFTPSNQQLLDDEDGDFGSGGPLLTPSKLPRLALGGGKDALLRVLNRDNLGGFTGRVNPNAANHALLNIGGFSGGFFSTPAYAEAGANRYVYVNSVNGTLKQFRVNTDKHGKTTLKLTAQTKVRSGYPSFTPTISSSGTTVGTGIVWAQNLGTGALHAFDAGKVSKELYNSNQNAARDRLGSPAKFTIPLVANGRVYAAASGKLAVYGILSP